MLTWGSILLSSNDFKGGELVKYSTGEELAKYSTGGELAKYSAFKSRLSKEKSLLNTLPSSQDFEGRIKACQVFRFQVTT